MLELARQPSKGCRAICVVIQTLTKFLSEKQDFKGLYYEGRFTVFGGAICPTRVRGADADALLAGVSNHPHGLDLDDRRTQHLRLARSFVFRWRRIWLLHRSRHFHLLVDVGRPFGLR